MERPGFLYLLTPQFAGLLGRTGIAADESGALALARLPSPAGPVSPRTAAGAIVGPAGIGVAEDGTLYISDPMGNRILRRGGCEDESAPLPCLGGAGSQPGQLNAPRGVLVGPRRCLYIADSGNHRIQVLDLDTLQVRAVWGQHDPFAPPVPGRAPGRLDEPWDLAADAQDRVYVLDHGNRRIQRFTSGGVVEPEFWDTLRAQRGVALVEPAAIAVALWQGQERLLVVDKGDAALKLFRTDGMYDDAATRVWTGFAVKNPAGLGIGGDRLYVGDADTASVLVFDLTGSLLGVVAAPQGTLCGLALDARGRLVLHAGSGTPILQLLSGQVFAREGRFLIGPIDVGGHSTTWQRLEVLGPLPTGNGHLRLHTLTSAQPVAPPAIPASASVEVTETPLDMWRSAPADALDARIFNAPGRYLWIAGVMVGDGTTSPLVRRIRVEYDRESWLRRLPAVYTPSPEQRDPADTLGGALALFRSTLEGEDRGIDGMSRRFDALAAPAEGAPQSWLDWLAGWLALVLPQDWSEGRKRDALRRIFRLYAWRGTAEGLEAFIEMYTGARARIIEPSQAAAVWALGADSRLGFGTPLGGAEAQGAVLGTTAEPGLSSLTTDGQYGTPLFEDRAHEFCVQVYAAEIKTPGAVELVRQVVEQEKPAHTAARVQVIDALLRVGIQATLGVDAIVAGPREMALGKGGLLGTDTALAAEPDRLTEGESPQLGLTSRLS